MSILKLILKNNIYRTPLIRWSRHSSKGCTHLTERVIDSDMKKTIEAHWRYKFEENRFDPMNLKDKFYVLSMFPYPSGSLHMGHVRVYTISDAIARFYRLNGKNVFHPMGWDAFGLPAENAAIQRQVPADEWTRQNIQHMKEQLAELGCSFDWQAELSTCDPAYYKWTQKLFLMMHEEGLIYQKESTVNWDPVDETVLADEQVDVNGCSWRSGAKVEKKLLKQWFVKTTKFAEPLYEGLNDPILQDWRDIVKLQRHWIGKCDGWNFELKAGKHPMTVWTSSPQDLIYAGFIAIKKDHWLNFNKIESGVLDVMLKNPFGTDLPIIVTDAVEFPPFNDVYIGVPSQSESDLQVANDFDLRVETLPLEDVNDMDATWVLEKAQDLGIGGDFKVSSKLKDWLISRQRYWGTPIPIVHCKACGTVPVKDQDLPVKLPELNGNIGQPLSKNEEWLKCSCPKCGGEARRETDTMDTFVDSSWYFLRYLNASDTTEMVSKNLAQSMMPVDIYVGGKEHAVLHLYYARFINHFLHQKGFVLHPEPFRRLLVQGMVMGQSYQEEGSGRYLKADEVRVVDAKKGKAIEVSTGTTVNMMWEKMSKSKLNGVEPAEVIGTHGCDTTRLIMLADVAPTSHRNWSEATFPGVLNWQRRLWMTVSDFIKKRYHVNQVTKSDNFDEQEKKLLDAVNFFTSHVTFNYKYTHQLSVAISKMQALTSAIRRSTPDVEVLGKNYERALAAQIVMLAPMAPHFASELWARFAHAAHKVSGKNDYINWSADVFNQKWPKVDAEHKIDLTFKINNVIVSQTKATCGEIRKMSEEQALFLALQQPKIVNQIKDKQVLGTNWFVYEDYEGIFTIRIDRSEDIAREIAERLEKKKQKKDSN